MQNGQVVLSNYFTNRTISDLLQQPMYLNLVRSFQRYILHMPGSLFYNIPAYNEQENDYAPIARAVKFRASLWLYACRYLFAANKDTARLNFKHIIPDILQRKQDKNDRINLKAEENLHATTVSENGLFLQLAFQNLYLQGKTATTCAV